MTSTSVLLVLLHLCGLHLMAVAVPTCRLQGDLVLLAKQHLSNLGAPFPLHCTPYNANVSLPDSALPPATANHKQCRQVSGVVHESLREAESLFEYDLPEGEGGVNWDAGNLDKFRQYQDQLVEEGRPVCHGPGVLSSYFGNVTSLVERQESAACGWMVLRRDLSRILENALLYHKDCFTWK